MSAFLFVEMGAGLSQNALKVTPHGNPFEVLRHEENTHLCCHFPRILFGLDVVRPTFRRCVQHYKLLWGLKYVTQMAPSWFEQGDMNRCGLLEKQRSD